MSDRPTRAKQPRARAASVRTPAEENVNILLVDDRPENLLALAALLDGPGRTLVTVGSGREALRALLRRDFAVILLDVNMPLMDGFETAALIRQRPASAHTPIIFVTAHGDEGQVQTAYSLGAVDYILAPINPEVLTAKIAVFVELFRKTAENRRQAEQLRHAEEQLRRHAEQELRETHARLQQVIDSVADYAIFSLDANARIATWNAGAERLFGYTEAAVAGRIMDVLLTPESQAAHVAAQQCALAITEGRGEIDTWFQRKDGSRFYGAGVITAMRDARGDLIGFSKVVRDITERRRAEEALRRQADELAEANRVKDEFLAVLSHELRTPLNAILGWSRMLLDGRLDPDMVRRALESIGRNAVTQLGLVNDILDVSRFVTGKFRMEIAPVDLRAIVEAAIETGRAAAEAKGIALEAVMPPLAATVKGDAARLQQVAWNLVSNAVKFTPDGGRVRVELDDDGRSVTLRVRDDGIGIAEDFLPYVFDRFRQADSSAARTAGGLGLGLAIVKHIVEMHGGLVAADSDGPGRGSVFTVCLPVAGPATVGANDVTDTAARQEEDPDSSLVGQAGSASASSRALDGVRCLLVDDDDDTRYLLRLALEGYGARVSVAASAGEALALVGDADVLLADLAMPGEDGYSLVRRVRARPPHTGGTVPAIALTAHATEGDRARALGAGFQEHLSKPADPARVVDAIQRLLKAAGFALRN